MWLLYRHILFSVLHFWGNDNWNDTHKATNYCSHGNSLWHFGPVLSVHCFLVNSCQFSNFPVYISVQFLVFISFCISLISLFQYFVQLPFLCIWCCFFMMLSITFFLLFWIWSPFVSHWGGLCILGILFLWVCFSSCQYSYNDVCFKFADSIVSCISIVWFS